MMHITFTRTGRRTYATVAVRDDGVEVRVPSFDRGASLPHDLAHFVVERTLTLPRGFWGCVADGAMFPGMAVVSGRRRPHADARSRAVQRDAAQQGTEAEVLVGTLLRIAERRLDDAWPAARALLDAMWTPGRSSRPPLSADDVQRVCEALRGTEQQWRALPIGESWTVSWPGAGGKRRR